MRLLQDCRCTHSLTHLRAAAADRGGGAPLGGGGGACRGGSVRIGTQE